MFCANKILKEILRRKRAKKREGKGYLDHNLTSPKYDNRIDETIDHLLYFKIINVLLY